MEALTGSYIFWVILNWRLSSCFKNVGPNLSVTSLNWEWWSKYAFLRHSLGAVWQIFLLGVRPAKSPLGSLHVIRSRWMEAVSARDRNRGDGNDTVVRNMPSEDKSPSAILAAVVGFDTALKAASERTTNIPLWCFNILQTSQIITVHVLSNLSRNSGH